MNIRPFVILLQDPENLIGILCCLFVCCCLFSLCCSDWVISIVLSSSSQIVFLCCWALPLSFKILVIIIFSSEISFWFCYTFWFFAKTFYFFAEVFSVVLSMSIIAHWSIFMTTAWNSLSDNSNISGLFIWHLLIVFFIRVEIFLILSMMNDFQLKQDILGIRGSGSYLNLLS